MEAGVSVVDNLRRVEDEIAEACRKAGRSRSEVQLVAVSKTKSIDLIREAKCAGQQLFGENYVQEMLEKERALPDVGWHFIGSLQTNKAKLIAGKCRLVHSVDREKLAVELSKAAVNMNIQQNVLLQVHVGGEDTKHGMTIEEAPGLLEVIMKLPNLRLCGIMAMPPLSESETVARQYFSQLRNAFEQWRGSIDSVLRPQFTEISMGTSSDFGWAILEGATIVRVGSSIFGSRQN